MPTWLTQILEPGMLSSVALVIFVLYLFIRACFKLYPFALKFVNLVHTLVGDEENPGIEKRMDAQGEKLDRIHHEVLPNHGSSMNDSMRRTEADVKALSKQFKEHIEVTEEWHPMLRVLYRDFNKKEEN